MRARCLDAAGFAAHEADGAAHGAIVRRNADGRAQVAYPDAPGDIATAKFVTDRIAAVDVAKVANALDVHIAAASVHGATSLATASRIMMRDGAGRAQVADPSAASDIATKKTVDDHAALTAPHAASSAAAASRLVVRDASGWAQVTAPSADADIATKAYVDAVSLLPGVGFWAWSQASNMANISSVAGSRVGDCFINTGSAQRTILGVAAAPGGVVRSASAAAGAAPRASPWTPPAGRRPRSPRRPRPRRASCGRARCPC
jgi:hypothetical protein